MMNQYEQVVAAAAAAAADHGILKTFFCHHSRSQLQKTPAIRLTDPLPSMERLASLRRLVHPLYIGFDTFIIPS